MTIIDAALFAYSLIAVIISLWWLLCWLERKLFKGPGNDSENQYYHTLSRWEKFVFTVAYLDIAMALIVVIPGGFLIYYFDYFT